MKSCLAVAFIILFCLPALIGYGQYNRIDSLKKILQSQKVDTAKVNILIQLASLYYEKNDYENTIYYGKEGLGISQNIHYKSGEADEYTNIGNAYGMVNNYVDEIRQYLLAIDIYKELGNINALSICYLTIENIHNRAGNTGEALKYAYAFLHIAEAAGDKNNIAEAYRSLGYFQEFLYTGRKIQD